MTDERLRRRVDELEALIRNDRRERSRTRRRAQLAAAEIDEAFLRGGSSGLLGMPAGTFGPIPDLGSPLARRLRADAGFDDAGSAALYSMNMLRDTTFERILRPGQISVGTGWTSVGAEWEARKVINSGSSPTVNARHTTSRKFMEGQIYRSDVLVLDTRWPSGQTGDVHVELRPKRPTPVSPHIDWPWAVAAARCYIDSELRPITNLDEDLAGVSMIIYDADGNELEAGDDVDLDELSDDRMEGQPWVGTDIVDAGVWMLLRINLTKSTSAGEGGVAVAVGEPQINYTPQEAPMPWEGMWEHGAGPVDGGDPTYWTPCDLESFTRPLVQGSDLGLSIIARFEGLRTEATAWTWTDIFPATAWMLYEAVGPTNGGPGSCGGPNALWTGWTHREGWVSVSLPAIPAGAEYLRIDTADLFGSPIGYGGTGLWGVRVSSSQPAGEGAGTLIGTFLWPTSPAFDCPVSALPPAGGTIYIGVSPEWDCNRGNTVCSITEPAQSGAENSGRAQYSAINAPAMAWLLQDTGTLGTVVPDASCRWWGDPLTWASSGSAGMSWGITAHTMWSQATAGASRTYLHSIQGAALTPLPMQLAHSWRLEARYRLVQASVPADSGLRHSSFSWEDNTVTLHWGDPTTAEGIAADGVGAAVTVAQDVPQAAYGRLLMEMHDGRLYAKTWAEGSAVPAAWQVETTASDPLNAGDTNYQLLRLHGSLGIAGGVQRFEVDRLTMGQRPEVGDEFTLFPVGVGDGVSTSFAALPTVGGSKFYVDGLLTIPTAYDPSTGVVTFDRAPSFWSEITQSGTAA